jgi:hypothetical protein
LNVTRLALTQLWLAERFGGVPPAVCLPDDRRVQALLDRGPDRERRREVVSLDGEVGPVAGAQLVDLVEQVVLRIPGEHIGKARLHADPDQRQPIRGAPPIVDGELLVAELHAGEPVRLVRVRLGQAHGHIEVVGAAGQRAVEDRHHESRIDRLHHMGDLVDVHQVGHRPRRRRVHPSRRKSNI